jgi:hypothetical protein
VATNKINIADKDPFLGDIDHGQPGIVLKTLYDDDDLRWYMVYQNGIDFKPYRAMNVCILHAISRFSD